MLGKSVMSVHVCHVWSMLWILESQLWVRAMASLSQPEWLPDAQAPTTTRHKDIYVQQVESLANHSGVGGLCHWYYSLHAILCILHLVLLAMLWHHPEHRFMLPFNNSILSSGLSTFLQAFYTTQTLTTTHDIYEAWGGLGAAALTLWWQTKVAVLTSATILVFLYLTCISVLHVASPTIMQFQPYNASQGMVIISNSTWPNPSVNLTSLDWSGTTPIAPLMFGFGSSVLSTSGLVNSTLYNTFPRNQAIVKASVNASTIRTNCGLLPVLSSADSFETFTFRASLSAMENITVDMAVSFSTAMELSSSIQTQEEKLRTLPQQFIPLPVHFLDVQEDILWSTMNHSDESSQGWSLWSSQATTINGTNSEALNKGILSALLSADFPTELGQPGPQLFCQGDFCPAISTIDVIMATSMSSAYPSITLSSTQLEVAISKLAAELIWLGESNGGFAFTSTSNDATEFVLRWKLNINKVSVISAVTASFVLLAIIYFVGSPTNQSTSINGISVLEILWIGAHTHKLREIFHKKATPSPEELRDMGVFYTCLITDVTGSNSERMKEHQISRSLSMLELEDGSTQVHIALISIFVHHTEHHIIIPLESMGITIACKAALQLFYTLYMAMLVFMTQQLTKCRAMTSRRDLTSVHDISRAWTGVGSAVISLSQQRKGPVSFWMTLWTTVYLACVSVLHISSSAVMEFQAFNGTTANMVQSTLAWPSPSVSLQDLNWTNITPLVTIVEKLPDLSTEGLFFNTVYDRPLATSESFYAIVNATAVDARCGNNAVKFVNPIELRSSQPHQDSCSGCDDYLFFFVTTAMEVDATSLVPGLSVGVNWTNVIDSLLLTYLVGCSLNATTVLDTLDLKKDILSSSHPMDSDMLVHSQQWMLWSSANASELSSGISVAMASALQANCPVSSNSNDQLCTFTSLDFYIMESLRINVTNSALTTGSSMAPVVILGQHQFEKTVSKIAAYLIWFAGHTDPVSFQPAHGTSKVTDEIVQLQLNPPQINIIPLVFALGASVIIFILVFYMVGVTLTRPLVASSLVHSRAHVGS
ncbi:hypothetical protein L210DRAFT_3506559 [Boletus edulis BED1]|uniref:Transmembrane protein n=1 Tax=Boletus edulis BED1 TaxID=1328754 RepID=A0AAD4GBF5_BOLED|nr:hypothetical protein L210DRAFT_3506559 [Boletus edulis BED1]